jgi:hypothetical protein
MVTRARSCLGARTIDLIEVFVDFLTTLKIPVNVKHINELYS